MALSGLASRETPLRLRVAAGAAFGVAVAAALAWLLSRNVGTWFYDPDDALRLVQARDWLAGQPWGDVDQHRMQPGGTHMHWSRLVDLPFAAVCVALRGWLGVGAAERAAMVAVPVAHVVPLAMAVAAVSGRRAAGVALALAALCSWALLDRFSPGRIDHHATMTVLATLACVTLLWRRAATAGACAGVATAACLAVGFEDLAVLAGLGVAIATLWALSDDRGRAAGYGLGLLGGALGSEAFVPDDARLATACDCLSGAWPVTLAVAGASLAALSRIGPRGSAARVACLVPLGAAAALPLALGGGGQCLSGPYPGLSATAAAYWLSRVGEMSDVLSASAGKWQPLVSAGTAVVLASALGICALAAGRRPSPAEACYAALALLTAVVGARYIRNSGLPIALAAPVLGRGAARLLRERGGPPLAAAMAAAALAPALALCLRVADDRLPGGAAGTMAAQCESREAWAALAALPPAMVVAPIDLGPEALAYTSHSVMAGGIHRASHGIDEQYEFLQGSEAEALAVADRDRVGYVAWCDGNGEMARSARSNPNGLAARLVRRDLPDWLRPIPSSGPMAFAAVDRGLATAAHARLARIVADLPPAPPITAPAR